MTVVLAATPTGATSATATSAAFTVVDYIEGETRSARRGGSRSADLTLGALLGRVVPGGLAGAAGCCGATTTARVVLAAAGRGATARLLRAAVSGRGGGSGCGGLGRRCGGRGRVRVLSWRSDERLGREGIWSDQRTKQRKGVP